MLLLLTFGLVLPPLAHSSDEDASLTFRPDEAREILQVLREYPLVVQERDSLREALKKATAEIERKDVVIAKQEQVISLSDQIIAKMKQIEEIRMKEVDLYRRIAATETERREIEQKRAEKWETMATWGTVIGTALGIAVGAFAAR